MEQSFLNYGEGRYCICKENNTNYFVNLWLCTIVEFFCGTVHVRIVSRVCYMAEVDCTVYSEKGLHITTFIWAEERGSHCYSSNSPHLTWNLEMVRATINKASSSSSTSSLSFLSRTKKPKAHQHVNKLCIQTTKVHLCLSAARKKRQRAGLPHDAGNIILRF